MTQTRQLFGTDGIRGVAGEFPLTRDSVYWIGRALGHDLIRANAKPRVVIGQDTRVSSQWIADRFLQGLVSVGVTVRSAGVITTPGVAYLARSHGFDAGVVISASHNPWTDNGIKIFSGDGYKLPDARELAIEKEIFALLQAPDASAAPESAGAASSLPGEEELRQDYVRWLAAGVATDLSGLRIAVDCANGAAAAEAPALFRALKVNTTFLNACARWAEYQRRLRGPASGNRCPLFSGTEGSIRHRCHVRRRRRPCAFLRRERARGQRRRGFARGGARDAGPQIVGEFDRGRDHHVQHGTGIGPETLRYSNAPCQCRRQVRPRGNAAGGRHAWRRTVGTHSLSGRRRHDRRRLADGAAGTGDYRPLRQAVG